MIIYDLNRLTRDSNQNQLYDLFEPTFEYRYDIPLGRYQVPQDKFMRIDLVCDDLYDGTNYVDKILNINSIDNPLNIKEDDVILYPNLEKFIDYDYKSTQKNVNKKGTQQNLLSPNKGTRKDSSRQLYVENNYTLPPTLNPAPINPVQIEQNQIVIR